MELFFFIVYLCEASLFFYLIFQQLTLKENPKRMFLPGILLNAFFLSVIRHICSDALFSICLSAVLYLALTHLFAAGNPGQKLIYGILFPIISIFSKSLVFVITRLFIMEESHTLLTEDILRIVMSTLYILILLLLVFLCSHTKIKQLDLPLGIHIALPILFFTGIISCEVIFFHILQYEAYTVHIDPNEKIILTCTLLSNLSIFICAILLTGYLIKTYQKNIALAEENRLQQLQQHQYQSILDNMKMLRTWRHDFSQHLGTLHYFVTQRQLSKAADYIQNLQENIHQAIPVSSTGNYVVDAVLSNKMFIMKHHGIPFHYKVFLPSLLPLSEMDLTSLLGNILDNAIESCLKLNSPENTFVKLSIQPHKDSLLIELENSSDGNYSYDSQGIPLSTKSGTTHGIGLRHIIQLVESANGLCRLEPQKNIFALHIILPLSQEEQKYDI